MLLEFRVYRKQEVFHEKTLAARNNQQIFHEKMDKGYEKERFESLSIKAPVAKKLKRYCKGISKSQSMTLLLMLEFFENNGISPDESIGPHIQNFGKLNQKKDQWSDSHFKGHRKDTNQTNCRNVNGTSGTSGTKKETPDPGE